MTLTPTTPSADRRPYPLSETHACAQYSAAARRPAPRRGDDVVDVMEPSAAQWRHTSRCAVDEADLTSLALEARDGAADALERLIAETRVDVARFIGRMTDSQSVEELTQETYIRALNGLPRFAARSSARTWLLSIARHTVVDRYRSAAVRPKTTVFEEWDAPRSRVSGYAARIDEQAALMDLLSRLGEARRRAFVLTQLEGYSYAEVAAMASVPVGTVRSRVARARGDLIRALHAAESTENEGVRRDLRTRRG